MELDEHMDQAKGKRGHGVAGAHAHAHARTHLQPRLHCLGRGGLLLLLPSPQVLLRARPLLRQALLHLGPDRLEARVAGSAAQHGRHALRGKVHDGPACASWWRGVGEDGCMKE